MTREPIVSGMFYESDPRLLKQQIEQAFTHKLGPGKISKPTNKIIHGAVIPHAGYTYSAPCAAHAYKAIAESKQPDVFIILGTHHTAIGSTSTVTEDWETPLGKLKVDKQLALSLTQTSLVVEENLAHMQEHSIEVQLPFIQYINKNAKILPIVVSSNTPYDELGRSILNTLKRAKKTACIIASSDFTHYGAQYGYTPFHDNIKANMFDLDRKAINHICKLDTKGFLDYINKTGATICGSAPISVLIDYCKLAGAKGKLLEYYTSADIAGNYEMAVGYASIIFENENR